MIYACENKMIAWFWEQIGGILIRQFPIWPEINGQNQIPLPAVIISGETKKMMPDGTMLCLEGRNVTVVEAKRRRLSMNVIARAGFYA